MSTRVTLFLQTSLFLLIALPFAAADTVRGTVMDIHFPSDSVRISDDPDSGAVGSWVKIPQDAVVKVDGKPTHLWLVPIGGQAEITQRNNALSLDVTSPGEVVCVLTNKTIRVISRDIFDKPLHDLLAKYPMKHDAPIVAKGGFLKTFGQPKRTKTVTLQKPKDVLVNLRVTVRLIDLDYEFTGVLERIRPDNVLVFVADDSKLSKPVYIPPGSVVVYNGYESEIVRRPVVASPEHQEAFSRFHSVVELSLHSGGIAFDKRRAIDYERVPPTNHLPELNWMDQLPPYDIGTREHRLKRFVTYWTKHNKRALAIPYTWSKEEAKRSAEHLAEQMKPPIFEGVILGAFIFGVHRMTGGSAGDLVDAASSAVGRSVNKTIYRTRVKGRIVSEDVFGGKSSLAKGTKLNFEHTDPFKSDVHTEVKGDGAFDVTMSDGGYRIKLGDSTLWSGRLDEKEYMITIRVSITNGRAKALGVDVKVTEHF